MPSSVPPSAGPRPRSRHFSMIRDFHLADFLTLGNAACGAGAVLLMVRNPAGSHAAFFVAVALIFAALAFDVFDGRVARARHTHSALGRELDSLADVISFGMAPAALGLAAGLTGGWDAVCLVYFVCCGVSRLARYNVTAESLAGGEDMKVKHFEGTPIPTSVILVAALAASVWASSPGGELPGGAWTIGPWELHPFALLYAISGSLMISKTLRVPKL